MGYLLKVLLRTYFQEHNISWKFYSPGKDQVIMLAHTYTHTLRLHTASEEEEMALYNHQVDIPFYL